MIELTDVVLDWLRCSNEAWKSCFSDSGYTDEFQDIEMKIFNERVLGCAELKGLGHSFECIISELRALSVSDGFVVRQFCVRQKAGNVYCQPRNINISSKLFFGVKSFDSAGFLSGGGACVELWFDGGFILDDPSNWRFYVPDSMGRIEVGD